MLSEKKHTFPIDDLFKLEPKETISLVSAYRLQPQNLEKEPIIEFLIRLAASYCRGTIRPTTNEINTFLKRVGEFYMDYLTENKPTLETFFSNQALFVNHVEGNLDQTIESLWKRFEKHDKFLEDKLGFNVANAIFFTNMILCLVTAKLSKTKPPKNMKLTKEQFYNLSFFVQPNQKTLECWSNAILFSIEEIKSAFAPCLVKRLQKYLEFVTIPLENIPKTKDPLEADPLIVKPLIKINKEYLIPTPYYLLHGLSARLQDELIKDFEYKGKFGKDKGRVLEERASEELRHLFKSGNIFRNIKYESAGSTPDSDIIVSYGEYLLFVECTSKTISQLSKQGNLASVNDTLDKSIRKCYFQALRAKRAFLEGRIKLQLDIQPSKFILMIVTETLFPNLLSEFILAQRFKTDSYLANLIEKNEYPYIISISDLQSIRCLANEKVFTDFILERLSMYIEPYFLAYDEYDYFILFSKPEYQEIKEKVISAQTVLDYVAHLPSPLAKPRTFHAILETIGSENFAIYKIGEKYDKTVVSIAFSLLYDIYCDWSSVKKHFVFDVNGFNSIIDEYHKKGIKCRAIVWEGFYEYLDFCRQIGHKKEIETFERKLQGSSLRDELNVLIVIPTDIYEDLLKEFRAKKKQLNKRK